MNRYLVTAALAAVALPVAPAAARDMQGYTLRSTILLAGPEDDYPPVQRLRTNLAVTVHGRLDDQSWCDVSTRTDRGWIEGGDIAISYRGRRRPLGTGMGIGILTFMFGSYWDDNYRSRPFYAERTRWAPQGRQADQRPWNAQGRVPSARGPAGSSAYRPFGDGAAQGSSAHGIAPPLDRNIPGGQSPRLQYHQPQAVPVQPANRLPMPDMHVITAPPALGPRPGVTPAPSHPRQGPVIIGTDGHEDTREHDDNTRQRHD